MKRKLLHITLLLSIITAGIQLEAQDPSIQVSGIITGIKNNPVPNVSVSVEGVVAIPAITNDDGSFTVLVNNQYSTLIITPPESYKSQTYLLSGRKHVNIKLTSQDVPGSMDKQIQFFDFIEKRNSTSSTAELNVDESHFSNNQTIDNQLTGKHSGIWGIGRSGLPGSGSSLYIRGIHSINANTQPLYVIDGIPIETHGIMGSFTDGYAFNPLTALNPADITDLTIIKDNAEAPLYGVRGSNGIVLIETLKPTEVQTIIDFNFRSGFTAAPRQIPQLNSDQYRTFAKEVLLTSNIQEELYPVNYPGLYVSENDPFFYKYTNDTDWQNIIFRNALMYDAYLRILGGDEIARYGLSVGFHNSEGVVDQTMFNRFSVRFVGSFNMFKWLKFNVSSTLTSNNSKLKESARIPQTSPVLTSLRKSPLMVPFSFDSEGNQLTTTEGIEELGVSNPYAVINGFSANNKNYRFLTTFKIEGDISEKLKINNLIGINFNSLNEKTFMPNNGMELYYLDEAFNASKSYSNYLYSITNDNYLNYKTSIGYQHTISANAGLRINTNKYQADWGIAKNAHENDEYKTLNDGTNILRELGGVNGNWNRMSVYTNVKYSFLDKYNLNLTASAENSTRIGPNANNVFTVSEVPFGLFYGAGFSWLLSEESFMRDRSWINELKLRLSYGKTGNDDIGNYAALNYFYPVHYRDVTGLIPGPMVDESLTFEEFYQFNSGIDFSTWGNRISATLEFFQNRTDQLLIHQKQDFYLGPVIIPLNDGEIENKGLEFEFYSRVLDQSKLKWDISLNISSLSNTVTELSQNSIITPIQGGEYITAVGKSSLNFYGYKFLGVYASSGDANLLNEEGLPFGAGDAIYEDISGPKNEKDGIIDEYDKTIIGSPIPDYYGGISTGITYGRWKMIVDVQGVFGNEVFNYVRSVNEGMTDLSNQSMAVLNRWQKEGQVTSMPRSLWGDPMHNTDFSSRWIEDASFIRLKNISLSYKIPEKFLLFRNAEFYITGGNLLTFTKYLGYDPEFAYSYNTMEQGIDYGLSPNTKSFMVGIKLGL
ncbi:SusC/RagA family TonB-linked outer membrane protein [Bacteroidota bacterium]